MSNGKQKRSLDFLDIILTAKDEEGKGLSDLRRGGGHIVDVSVDVRVTLSCLHNIS